MSLNTSPSKSSVTSRGQQSSFDKLSFVRYMKNIGRAYRKQATELISLCRTFVQAQEQTPDSDAKLRNALQAVDDALRSAADIAAKKTSKEVDEKFERAIEVLSHYETECHPNKPVSRDGRSMTVLERMETAKAKDKSSSTILNVLKEKLSLKVTKEEQAEPTTVVEFLLLKSLPDKCPTIVKQVLSPTSNLQEILWNFSRFKDERRLTLKQNPHFYKHSDLPASREAYVGDFKTDPIDSFQDAKICVLTDKPGRIFLETDQNSRAFGNVWVPNDAMIFKDVCGKLEGERVVHASLQGAPNLWYLEEPPLSPTSLLAVSPSQSSTSPIMTPSPTSSVSDGPFQDWREPIRQSLVSRSVDIRIRASSPSISSPSSPSPPFSTPSVCSNDRDGSLSMLQIPAQTPAHQMHRSARSSQLSPLSKFSARRSVPSSPTPAAPPVPPPLQSPKAASPLEDRTTPTPAPGLAPPIAPLPCDVSRRPETQDCSSTGEAPPSLHKLDVRSPTPLLTVTVTSPCGETAPNILQIGGEEARIRRNKHGKADAVGSEQKGTANLAPDIDATFPRWSVRLGRLQGTQAWQFWSQLCNQSFK